MLVQRADAGAQPPGPGADAVGGGVDGGQCAVRQAGGDEGGGVLAGDGARRDAAARRSGAGDAVEAEEAPVGPVGVVGQEVPQVAGGDQVAGLGAARGGRAPAGGVVEGEDLVVAAGGGEGGQEGRVGPRPAVLPDDAGEGGLDGCDLAAQAAREDLFELGQGPQGGLLDADEAACGGAQGDRDGDGLVVLQEEGRQVGAGAQAVAAGVPAGALDRVAQYAQPVHVPAHGADGHLQPLGQVGARPVPPGLQQGQQPQHAGGHLACHAVHSAGVKGHLLS